MPDSLSSEARPLRRAPAATDDALGNARASVVRRTPDTTARGRRARAGLTNGQIVKEAAQDLSTDFRGGKIISREVSGSCEIALGFNSFQFPTAKAPRSQRGEAMNKTNDLLPIQRFGSRTAAARERQRHRTREYLTERKAPRFQLLFDHPLHRPPLLFF